MSAESVTAIVVGVVVPLITLAVIPLILNRKVDARLAASESAVSWEAINKALVKERDEDRGKHEQRMRELQSQHVYELSRANEQIRQLTEQVNGLYRRLYQQQGQGGGGR